MIVVPVTHDLIHSATVDTARLPLSLLDEVAEERRAWRKRHMVDVAVQGLVHSEHELSHAQFLSSRGTLLKHRARPAARGRQVVTRGHGRGHGLRGLFVCSLVNNSNVLVYR